MLTFGHRRNRLAFLLLGACAATGAAAQGSVTGGAHGGARGSPTGETHGGGTATPAMALSAAERAEMRFPQPVRVGDLTDRLVIEPSNHQGVIGRVAGVARSGERVDLIVRYGGLLGFGTRTIAVPAATTALLGQYVQVLDLDAAQLEALPEWTAAAGTPVGNDERIRIGINRN